MTWFCVYTSLSPFLPHLQTYEITKTAPTILKFVRAFYGAWW